MPLYGTGYVFSKPFFRFWVVWTFLWAWAAALIITLLPLWQGRHTLRFLAGRAIGLREVAEDRSSGKSVLSEEIVVTVEADEKLLQKQ